MKIYIAKGAGFCAGVKRAVDMAFNAVNFKNEPVYTAGPIIHNPQVVDKLAKENVKIVKNPLDVTRGTIIVAAHGISPDIREILVKRNLKIVDATCSIVKRSQQLVQNLKNENYNIVIIGEEKHPEVKALLGYAGKNAITVNTEEEVERLPKLKKVGVVVQTTLSFGKFQMIVAKLLKKTSELKIYNTICNATAISQKFSLKMSKEVDIMIVIGGKNSANTKNLAKVCFESGAETHHIEEAGELKSKWFIDKKKVGITAGTSTPDWIIQEVVKRIQNLR